MTETAIIVISFHCETPNVVLVHSHKATVVTTVRMVLHAVRKDPEQTMVGFFAEFEINGGLLYCFKRENRLPVS